MKPVAPAPIVKVIENPLPPCILPDLPAPFVLGGVPQSDDRLLVTADGMQSLRVYLAKMKAWIVAANRCLATRVAPLKTPAVLDPIPPAIAPTTGG